MFLYGGRYVDPGAVPQGAHLYVCQGIKRGAERVGVGREVEPAQGTCQTELAHQQGDKGTS